MKPLHIILPAMLAALLLSGCATPLSEEDVTRGTSTLTLSVGVDHPQLLTKTGETETPSLTYGSAFNSLLVVLVNNQDKVVETKRLTTLPGAGVTSTNITFAQLTSGDYRIYAFGNDNHTDWLETSTTLSVLSEGDDMPTVLLKNPGPGSLEKPVGTGMLISGSKSISIGNQNHTDSVILYRPVVHFKVVLENNTDFPVTLTDLNFNDFSASRSYLVDQRTSLSALPVIPDGNTYGPLPSFTEYTVEPHSKDVVDSCLLFENAAPTEYIMKASLKMNAGTDASPDWHYLDLGKPVPTLMEANDINVQGDAEFHNLMLLNPQNNYQYGRLIGLNSDDPANIKILLRAKPTSGGTVTDYQQWLQSIIANPALKKNFVLTLKKESGQFRLFDRKGNNLFAYLRDGDYESEGPHDAKNEANDYAMTYMTQASSNPNNKFDASFASNNHPYLLRLYYTYSNTKYYLWCRAFTSTETREGLWTRSETSQPGWQDRHFVFFQLQSSGSPLKRIDEKTGRIDPVTYMPRNTEVTALISVYYNGEGQAEISYEVKNWEEVAEAGWTFGKWDN